MRGKIMAVVALGLSLAAGQASAQQSDLLPRQELRNNLRRLRDDLRADLPSRVMGARIRAEALETARARRESALEMARMNREFARRRIRMPAPRITRMPMIRERLRRRFRDI